nr:putative feruloyl esterase A [Ipomoea batatas]
MQKVKDSWRVVNHRDIIPTVPRLMGYCHVAQPVYLAAGNLKLAMANIEQLEDGYQGDIIGEATPDVIVSEFMKGEKELIEKILNTEINIFRAIRDGSALMQHMEDFYYITLLEADLEEAKIKENVKLRSFLEQMELEVQETKELLTKELPGKFKEIADAVKAITEENAKLKSALEAEMRVREHVRMRAKF